MKPNELVRLKDFFNDDAPIFALFAECAAGDDENEYFSKWDDHALNRQYDKMTDAARALNAAHSKYLFEILCENLDRLRRYLRIGPKKQSEERVLYALGLRAKEVCFCILSAPLPPIASANL